MSTAAAATTTPNLKASRDQLLRVVMGDSDGRLDDPQIVELSNEERLRLVRQLRQRAGATTSRSGVRCYDASYEAWIYDTLFSGEFEDRLSAEEAGAKARFQAEKSVQRHRLRKPDFE